MSKLLYLFFFLGSYISLQAQICEISGEVKLSDSSNSEGIMIQLLNQSKTKILSFRSVDSTGSYEFRTNQPAQVNLFFTQFGYSDTLVTLNCQEKINLKTIYLQPINVSVDEISIVEKIILQKKSGDTTKFILKNIEKGYEQSATDIINNIPGFNIEGSQYTYQNKPIEFVLVNGKNLADNNQVEFTDGVFYQYIEDIHLIENYGNGIDQTIDSSELNLLLDIRIKEKFRNKLQTTLSLDAGVKNSYNGSINTIKPGVKTGFRTIIKYSNIQSDRTNFDQSSYINNVRDEILYNGRYTVLRKKSFLQLNPQRILPPNSIDNKSIKFFLDNQINDKTKLISNITIHRINELTNIDRVRIFQPDNSELGYSSNISFTSFAISASNSFTSKIGSKTNLEIRIPFNLSDNINDNVEEIRTDKSLSSLVNTSLKNYSITPKYTLKHRLGNDFFLTLFGKFDYFNDSSSFDILSQDAIRNGFSINDSIEQNSNGNQATELVVSRINNQIRIQKTKGSFSYFINSSFSLDKESVEINSSTASRSLFSGSETLNQSFFNNTLRIMYDSQKIRFAIAAIHSEYISKYDFEESKLSSIDPRILMMYKINKDWNLSIGQSVIIDLPDIMHLFSLEKVEDQVNFRTGMLNPSAFTKKSKINLSIFKNYDFNDESENFNLSLGYYFSGPEIQSIFQIVDEIQLMKFTLVHRIREINASLSYQKKYRKSNLSLRINTGSGQFLVDDVSVNNFIIRSSFSSQFFIGNKLKLDFGLKTNYSRRTQKNESFSNLWVVPTFKNIINFQNNTLSIGYQLQSNNFNSTQSYYNRFDIEFVKNKLVKNLHFSIQLNDFLNLSSTNNSVSRFNTSFIETDTYNTFPGQILLGIKWQIK